MRNLSRFVTRYPLLVAFAFVLAAAGTALAQTVPDPLAPPDFKAVGTAAILALTPVLGVVILWGLKVAWSKIPASIVIFAAPVLGIVVNYGVSYLLGHPPADPMLAAAAGALATYLREFGTTLATKGVAGGVSITKAMF